MWKDTIQATTLTPLIPVSIPRISPYPFLVANLFTDIIPVFLHKIQKVHSILPFGPVSDRSGSNFVLSVVEIDNLRALWMLGKCSAAMPHPLLALILVSLVQISQLL